MLHHCYHALLNNNHSNQHQQLTQKGEQFGLLIEELQRRIQTTSIIYEGVFLQKQLTAPAVELFLQKNHQKCLSGC